MYIQQGTDKDVFTGEGGGGVGERNLLLCWRKEGTSLTFGNFTVNFCNKSKFSSGHLLIPPIPARSVHDSGVLLLFCELHEKYHINNRTSSIHVQYIFLFNIVTMAMYTTLIQYQHNIVRHRRYFFDVNIVDFATSTVFNRYRVYTVDFADISLTFTSSTWQCIRC